MFSKSCLSRLLIFSTLSFYFLFVTPKICLLNRLLPNPPISFISSHACGWLLYQFWSSLCYLFSLSWFIGVKLDFTSLRLIHLLLIYVQKYKKVIIIGKHVIYTLIVWPGRWVSCPVFSNYEQFFSLLNGSSENWMPVKCQRVSEQCWVKNWCKGGSWPWSCSEIVQYGGQWAHSCGLGLEEPSGGVDKGGSLCSVESSKFGSDLVFLGSGYPMEYNFFKKFQVY